MKPSTDRLKKVDSFRSEPCAPSGPPITGWGIMVLVVSTGRAVFAG